MGSVIGHRIDYNGLGVLRGQRHIPSENWPKYPPRAKDLPSFCWNNEADRLSSRSVLDKQTKDHVLIPPREKENNGPQKNEKTLVIMMIGLLKGPEIDLTTSFPGLSFPDS